MHEGTDLALCTGESPCPPCHDDIQDFACHPRPLTAPTHPPVVIASLRQSTCRRECTGEPHGSVGRIHGSHPCAPASWRAHLRSGRAPPSAGGHRKRQTPVATKIPIDTGRSADHAHHRVVPSDAFGEDARILQPFRLVMNRIFSETRKLLFRAFSSTSTCARCRPLRSTVMPPTQMTPRRNRDPVRRRRRAA